MGLRKNPPNPHPHRHTYANRHMHRYTGHSLCPLPVLLLGQRLMGYVQAHGVLRSLTEIPITQ